MLNHVLIWGRWIGIYLYIYIDIYVSFRIKHWVMYDLLLLKDFFTSIAKH